MDGSGDRPPARRDGRWSLLRRRVNLLTLATPLGLVLARWGRAEVVPGPDGLLLAGSWSLRLLAPRAGAVTVGDVVLLRADVGTALARPGLLAHEARHAAQWACWLGPLGFLPAYGVASAWSWLRCRDAAVENPFEVRAGLADGGYAGRARAVAVRRSGGGPSRTRTRTTRRSRRGRTGRGTAERPGGPGGPGGHSRPA